MSLFLVVSLDSVDEHEQAIREDARCTLLMHDTRSASGGSHGVHPMLLSTPAMHALWPTRLRRASGGRCGADRGIPRLLCTLCQGTFAVRHGTAYCGVRAEAPPYTIARRA